MHIIDLQDTIEFWPDSVSGNELWSFEHPRIFYPWDLQTSDMLLVNLAWRPARNPKRNPHHYAV